VALGGGRGGRSGRTVGAKQGAGAAGRHPVGGGAGHGADALDGLDHRVALQHLVHPQRPARSDAAPPRTMHSAAVRAMLVGHGQCCGLKRESYRVGPKVGPTSGR
jgi:hypothetical protein